MVKNDIVLQFSKLDYQDDCVQSVVNIFTELEKTGINNLTRTNTIGKALKDTDLAKSINPKSNNIDILMETGTGKTFTFLDTIFNINKENDHIKKFIILVPSIAIREGTKSNVLSTEKFFLNEYTKTLDAFYLDSKLKDPLTPVRRFLDNDDLSILVLNYQSFNSSAQRLLNKRLDRELSCFTDDEQPDTWLHAIASICDVVIMDEPHRFLGTKFKEAFKIFHNKPVLRFGATFPKTDEDKVSNLAYILDGVSAFSQNLVKRIVVNTIGVAQTSDKLVSIPPKSPFVEVLAKENGILITKQLLVGEKYNSQEIKKINKKNIVLDDDSIIHVEDDNKYTLSEQDINIMLDKTIQLHFKKEYGLFKKGIKTLSLFFIKKVSDYRDYDNQENYGFIAYKLEELYKQHATTYLENNSVSTAYKDYLQTSLENIKDIHGGYFSKDNSKKDEEIKKQVEEILKDKNTLLSLSNPRKFIFSQWALQEGWDNPNIFNICKLSSTSSDITKTQQVGRGLRIAVNQKGIRQTIDKFDSQDDFYEINSLDMVVSSHEIGFINQIQNEIKETSIFIDGTFRQNNLMKKLLSTNVHLAENLNKIIVLFEKKNAIKRNPHIKTDCEYIIHDDFTTILQETFKDDMALNFLELTRDDILEFSNLVLDKDFDIAIDSNNPKLQKQDLIIKKEKAKEFKLLWDKINKQAIYTTSQLKKDEEKALIQELAEKINSRIKEETLYISNTIETLNNNNVTGAIHTKEDNTIKAKAITNKINLKSFILDIVNKTNLPINFIIDLLNKVNYEEIGIFNNPKQVQQEIIEIIKSNIFDTIVSRIDYEITGDLIPHKNLMYDEKGEFKTKLKPGSTGKNQIAIEELGEFSLKNKWLFENVIETDSTFERKCIEKDSDFDKIIVFAKLPNLKIKTPVGEYNPDFAYFLERDDQTKLFLIIETKGYKGLSEIHDKTEYKKIKYAEKFFNTLKNDLAKDNIIVSYKPRIENQKLKDLITNAMAGE